MRTGQIINCNLIEIGYASSHLFYIEYNDQRYTCKLKDYEQWDNLYDHLSMSIMKLRIEHIGNDYLEVTIL